MTDFDKHLQRYKRGGYLIPVANKSPRIARWARFIADRVRNVDLLEDLHSGITPSTKTGDYSDVKVVTPYGEIPWNNLSRISDKEMHELMVRIEKIITFTLREYEGSKNDRLINSTLQKMLFSEYGVSWNRPQKMWNELNRK